MRLVVPTSTRWAPDWAIALAFAARGARVICCDVLAEELGETPLRVRTMASKLAAGGVLTEAVPGCLAVRPEPLRHALVRDVFYKDAARLPVDGLLARAPNLEGVVRTLIGARGRGGTCTVRKSASTSRAGLRCAAKMKR